MPTDPLSLTFAALADPTRREILTRLAQGEATVNELAEPFEVSLPAISRHLKVLERAGLIVRGREAQWRPSRMQAEPLDDAMAWMQSRRRTWEARVDRLHAPLRREGDLGWGAGGGGGAGTPGGLERPGGGGVGRAQVGGGGGPARCASAREGSPGMSEVGVREVVITRVFDAPREEVFRAWTDPAEVAAWYGPSHFSAPRERVNIDLRVGGRW